MRHLLLAFLFVFAQAGGLAHGFSHGFGYGFGHSPDQSPGDAPVCEQCLAYAPMGAAAASTPLAWSAPAPAIPFETVFPASFTACFQSAYRSRGPPRSSASVVSISLSRA